MVEFDHNLWHRANVLGRGDKNHNLQIAMALYRSHYKKAKKGDLYSISPMNEWHKILHAIVFSS